MKSTWILAALTINLLSGHLHALTLNFDAGSGGTFLNDFNQDGPNAPNFFQNTVGGGINGTNAIDLTSNTGDATAIYRPSIFDFSIGTPTITISSYFRNQQAGVGSATGAFQLGLASDGGDVANTVNTGTPFNGTGAYSPDSIKNFVGARLRGDGAIEFQTGLNGVTTNSGITATNVLTAGNFYFLTTTFARSLTTNTFSGSVTLYNSDSAGVLGSQIASITSTTLTNSALWNDATAFAGFRAAGQTGGGNGANLVDNFSITFVPEPSAGLVSLLGVAGLLLRRRRA